MADQDGKGCITCLDREGVYCQFIVILGWLSIVIPTFTLIVVTFLTFFKKDLFSLEDKSSSYIPVSQGDQGANSKQAEMIAGEILSQHQSPIPKNRE